MKYIMNFDIKNRNKNKLDEIVYIVRNRLEYESNKKIKDSALINKCDYACDLLKEMLDKEHISCRIMDTNDILGNYVLGHNFLIVRYLNKNYIMDITYLQFFIKKNCLESVYRKKDDYIYITPDPGYYYVVNKNKRSIAKEILEYGYIQLDDNSLKTYLDSFYLTRTGRIIDINIPSSAYFNSINKRK